MQKLYVFGRFRCVVGCVGGGSRDQGEFDELAPCKSGDYNQISACIIECFIRRLRRITPDAAMLSSIKLHTQADSLPGNPPNCAQKQPGIPSVLEQSSVHNQPQNRPILMSNRCFPEFYRLHRVCFLKFQSQLAYKFCTAGPPLQSIMQRSLDLKVSFTELQPRHCLKCGTCHAETQCTTFVELFYWEYKGEEVFLIGSWSHWKKKEPMVKMDGYYEVQVSLNPGAYQYKFIVDDQWMHDQKQPVILNEFGSYNNVRQVYPKRAYLDQHYVCELDEDETIIEVDIESTLPHEGLKVVGSWDNWTVERPLQLETNLLKNCLEKSVKIKLLKGNRYQFKFKNNKGQYFIDESYPAVANDKGSMNNYILTSSFIEAKTPRAVLQSITKSNSMRQTQWEWQRQEFEDLPSYNLYGHSLTCIGEIIYIFGGIYKSQFRDYLIKIPLCDLSQYSQDKVDIPPRAYHTSVADGNKILIFGGLNTTVLNDSYIYNTATGEWSEQLVIAGAGPSHRQKSTSVLYKDTVILYGGYYCCPKTGTEIIHNDIHVLDTQSLTWNKPLAGSTNAPARFAHSATMHGDDMFVFGGICSTKQDGDSNQLWRLRIYKDHWTWSLAQTKGTPPSPRHGHTANILSHYLTIFGGANNKQLLNDVVMLDLDTMEWIAPRIYGEVPRAVVYHAAISVANELIVIGGKTEMKCPTSIFILKPKALRRKSFSTLSPSFDEENDTAFY